MKPKRRINAFNNQQNDYNAPNLEDFSAIDKREALQAKRNLEFEVFKACTSGTKEIVEKYIKGNVTFFNVTNLGNVDIKTKQ